MRVEFDVQLSVDGVPVVIHDPTLDRTTGQPGSVLDLPWDRLRDMVLRDHGLTAPLSSLAEVAGGLATHPSVTAFVELKRHSIERFGAAASVKRCLDVLEPLAGRFVFTSFEAPALEAAREQGVERIAWVLRTWDEASLAFARRLRPDYLFCNHEKLPPDESPLPAGGWRWVVYEVRAGALARSLLGRGTDLLETMAVGELAAALVAAGAAADAAK
jgi:glycerophosphoryl diester phosphodiesterase